MQVRSDVEVTQCLTVAFYHYAPWRRLTAIVESGELRPGNAGGGANEPPLLWFSTHPYWEPTATKAWRVGGRVRRMTFEEHRREVGCVRFELVKPLQLLEWNDACRFAGIGREERRNLQRIGQKLGANPAHWFASPLAVPLADVRLQILLDEWGYATDLVGMGKAWDDRFRKAGPTGDPPALESISH
jgi:hypothetical protein